MQKWFSYCRGRKKVKKRSKNRYAKTAYDAKVVFQKPRRSKSDENGDAKTAYNVFGVLVKTGGPKKGGPGNPGGSKKGRKSSKTSKRVKKVQKRTR